MDNWKPWIASIKKNKYSFLGILILLAIPVTLVLVFRSQDSRSSAATPDKLEAEAGTLSSSGVSKQSDSGASGGQFVRFDSPSVPLPTTNPNIEYNDVFVPENIDQSGNTDVSTALNNFIASVPDGTSENNHVRVVFPEDAIYMVSRGVCIGDKSHVTFWGNGTTIKVNPNATGPYQYTSAFNLGWRYGGSPSAGISSGRTNTDIRITGFSGVAYHTPIPGEFAGTYENQSFIEAGSTSGLEIDNNTNIRGFGGDFMRSHSNNVYVHDNSQINAGRQGISVINGSDYLIENNDFGSVGYYILDLEPNYENQFIKNIIFKNNIWTSYSRNSGLGGGFVAFANGKGAEWSNITISGNKAKAITTDNYGPSSTCRIYINNRNVAGRNINNVVIDNNSCAQSDSGPLIYVHGVNNLQITNNSQPHTGTLIRQSNNAETVDISGNTPN